MSPDHRVRVNVIYDNSLLFFFLFFDCGNFIDHQNECFHVYNICGARGLLFMGNYIVILMCFVRICA